MTPAQEAQWGIVLGERDFIRALAVKLGVGSNDMADAVQGVLVQAWLLLRANRFLVPPDVEPRDALRMWLVAITRRVARGIRRKQRTDVDALDEGTAGAVSPFAQLEARETLRILTYRLNREEEALLVALASGVNLCDLAARMGVPAGTVHTRVRKLRRILRDRRSK